MKQLTNIPKLGEAPDSGAIQLESSPFEESFKPGALPQITVPDLPEDATGLSAEAMSNIPTLTDLVGDLASEPVVPNYVAPQVVSPAATEKAEPDEVFKDENSEAVSLETQDSPAQADQWRAVLQARMGKLTGDIHTLNSRLDRLEGLNKTKVKNG